MEKKGRSVEKQIHTVRAWLDKAEQSYASDASIKGQLELLMAKAEMQHLDERQRFKGWRRSSLLMGGIGTVAVLVVAAMLYAVPPLRHDATMSSTVRIMPIPWKNAEESHSNNAKYPWVQSVWNVPEGMFSQDARWNVKKEKTATISTEIYSSERESREATTERVKERDIPIATQHSTIPKVNRKEIQRAVQEGEKILRGND